MLPELSDLPLTANTARRAPGPSWGVLDDERARLLALPTVIADRVRSVIT